MLEIASVEAENAWGALLDRVQGGEQVVIPRSGKPIARLVPDAGATDSEQADAAARRILARSKQLRVTAWEELRQDRDAGRV